jgi:hypothetical protein
MKNKNDLLKGGLVVAILFLLAFMYHYYILRADYSKLERESANQIEQNYQLGYDAGYAAALEEYGIGK